MLFLRKKSIRTKLILLLTGTATATVMAACTILWMYQFLHSRTSLLMEESSQAQVIADSSSAALLFGDSTAARETLNGLHADPRVELVCLYDKYDRLFTQYPTGMHKVACPETTASANAERFSHKHLIISRRILMRGEPVGTLLLQVGLHDLYISMVRFGETILCALLFASVFAFLLASLLHGIISRSITHLTDVATRVSKNGDYLVRAVRTSDDEIGVMIDQFNRMMEQIQTREEQLREAHDNLEDKVEERTEDLRKEIVERRLIEQALDSARIAAEEANRAKSAFLANMSHELRTPLNAIIGYSELLLEDAEADGQAETVQDLERIVSSSRHLLSLISDILDISKIEAGQMKVALEDVPASSLLPEVVSTARILAAKNNNTFHTTGLDCTAEIMVDSFRLRQCLLNLVSNACKFTKDGTITLALEQIGNGVIFKVTDTGIGISTESQRKLFQAFTQADASTTRQFGGTGLGLAISQQLCVAMGGTISVQSEMGRGSTFTISFPMSRQDETGPLRELALHN